MAKIKDTLADHVADPRLLDERGPTRHRLNKAEQFNPRTGEVTDFYERGNASRAYTLRDSPLERAHAKQIITDGHYQAGGKYYAHWYRAGMRDNLGSMDLNRVFGQSGGGLAASESAQFHYDRFKDAVKAMGPLGSAVITGFVCYEMSPDDIGRRHLNYSNAPQARAAAVTLIRDKLETLRILWGMA